MAPDTARARIVDLLRERVPALGAVYLFGSRAAGNEADLHPESDWDIAFAASGKTGLTSLERFALAADVAGVIPADAVDLIDLRRSPGHTLRMNVIDGERLWAADPEGSDVWEAKQATMAADFYLGERELREAYIQELKSRVAP